MGRHDEILKKIYCGEPCSLESNIDSETIPTNPHDLLEWLIKNFKHYDGRSFDGCIRVFQPHCKHDEFGFGISMSNYESFKVMARDADYISYSYEEGKAYLAAVYLDVYDELPRRLYLIRVESDNFMGIAKELFLLNPCLLAANGETTINLKVGYFINMFSLLEACKRALRRKPAKKVEGSNEINLEKASSIIFEGRKARDLVDKFFVFKTNSCIVCNSDEQNVIMTSTLAGDKKVTHSYLLCKDCVEKSKNYPSRWIYIQHKLMERVKKDVPNCEVKKIQGSQLLKNEYMEWLEKILRNRKDVILVENKHDHKGTIKVKLTEDFELTLRLTSPDDYAYIVEKAGIDKPILKIDSRDHHHYLLVQPDHIHPTSYDNSIVESSYTYGNAIFDLDYIFKEIEKIRQK